MIQVVDAATPPEHKSGPKRGKVAVVSTGFGLIVALLYVVLRQWFRRATADPANARKLNDLRNTFGRKTVA